MGKELSETMVWGRYLSNNGIKTIFHKMDYPFLATGVFYENPNRTEEYEIECFGETLKNLAFKFMSAWAISNLAKDKIEKTFEGFAAFGSQFNPVKIYQKICSGEDDPAEMLLPVSNAVLVVKRFGNSLGIKLKSNNSRGEDHENGNKLLEEMCQRDERIVQKFVHSVEFIIPLETKQAPGNSKTVDLGEIHEKLAKSHHNFSWTQPEEFATGLVDAYKTSVERSVSIGKYRTNKTELQISARLFHFDWHSNKAIDNAIQWRIGNVQEQEQTTFLFLSGEYLCLSIIVDVGLPQYTNCKTIDKKMRVGGNQTILDMASASLYFQIISQQLAELSLRMV